jgi:hypothetical protein
MTDSTNLKVTLIDPNQQNKHITANDAFDAFDRIFADTYALNTALNPSPYTVPSPDPALRFLFLVASGALTADYNVVLPTNRHLFLAKNSTTGGFNLIVKCLGHAGVTILPGTSRLCYVDGTDVTQVGVSADNGPTVVSLFAPGLPAAGVTVLRTPFTRPVAFAAGLANSKGICGVAPTGAVTLGLLKNGGSIGSVNFAAGATVATFTFATAVTFSAGDILQVTAPGVADATFADVAISLEGNR